MLLPDGSNAYTRDGVFELDGNNNLVTQSGYFVEPTLALAISFRSMEIGSHGTVTVIRDYTQAELDASPSDAPRDGIREDVSRMGIIRLVNPGGLESVGERLFQATADSQPPIVGVPSEDGMCEVLSGWLEASNVSIATEMTQLVLASRSYQLNLSAFKTLKRMLSEANQLI